MNSFPQQRTTDPCQALSSPVAETSTRHKAIIVISGLIVFSPLIEGGTTHVAALVIRLMIISLLVMYLIASLRAGLFSCPRLNGGLPMFLFLAIAVLSTIVSPYTNQSLQWLIVLGAYALLVCLVVFFVTQWTDVIRLLMVLTAVGVGEAVWAIAQGFYLGWSRPSGTFFNANFLAGYLTAAFAIALGVSSYAGGTARKRSPKGALCSRTVDHGEIFVYGGRRRMAWTFGWMAVLSLLLTGIITTGSRAGLIALLIAGTFVILCRYRWRGTLFVLVGLMVLITIPNPMRDRIAAEHAANPVAYARWQIWKQAVVAVGDYPLGYGLGLYQYLYPRYAFPVEGEILRFGRVAQTAHNEYLQIGIELGIIGLAIFLWGVVRLLMDIYVILRARLHRWQRGIIVGTAGGIISILTHAALDSNLHEPGIAIVLAVAIGIMASVRRIIGPSRDISLSFTKSHRWAWSICAMALIVFLTGTVARAGTAWICYEYGSNAQRDHDPKKAISSYQLAIKLDSGKALYHSALASVYFKNFEVTRQVDDAEKAVGELRVAIERNPLDGRLFGILGHVYASLGRRLLESPDKNREGTGMLRVALLAYEHAKELDPFSPFHRLEIGRLYVELERRSDAIEEVTRVLELEPNFLPAREWLAKTYLSSQSNSERLLAMKEYHEILDRQRRYAHIPKNALEIRFLTVDASRLAAELYTPPVRVS